LTSLTPSLLIGSDVLGWQEFGPDATLGIRTKEMPGGDGSLEFSLPGDVAQKYRNVIVPEALVKLTVDGERDYGGYLVCDPLRHRLGAQDTLELSAAGPWAMAARSNRYAYLGIDTDQDRWHQYRAAGDHFNRFTVQKEGGLELRADNDRTYANSDGCRLYYFIHDGLYASDYFGGMTFEYKLSLPNSDWYAGIYLADSPAAPSMLAYTTIHDTVSGNPHTGWTNENTSGSWIAAHTVIGPSFLDKQCVMLELVYVGAGASPASDPYIKLRKVILTGKYLDGTYHPDMAQSPATILADCAADLGVTTTRIDGLTTAAEQFIARYPTNIAAVIEQATLLEAAPVEAYFDLAPDGTFRFTANTRPTSVDTTRNRLWSVGGRGGEDLAGLRRDWEATPEQVEVLYAVKNDATLPDGMVKAARYPASVTATFPLVETVDLTGEPPMTAALAAQYAQVIYAARQDSLYAGDVALPQTALTSPGPKEGVPTLKLRPGDRLSLPSLLDADADGLYVQRVSYDFRTQRCTPTVGEPWDPLGFRPRTAARETLGSKGHVQTKTTRYLRRGGAT